MNAQQLAALGAMVREAIETHVTEAVKAVSEAFGAQLSQRDQKIDALTAQLQQLKNYDDSEIKAAVQSLRESIPAPYNELGLKHEIGMVAGQLKALRENIPAPYDDSEIKQMVADVEKRIGGKHARDTESLLGRISEVAKSIPSAYDDTALRTDLTALIKQQDEQIQTVAKMVSERPTPADGRDALQLEVLPAIDEAKSYTRGTYAKHAGGLWRAFEQTSGMRGWECIVEGVKELQVDMADKRLSVKAVMSSGAFAEMVKELPLQIYRGVFKSDNPYYQGDTVTWAGSLWHCNVTGTKAQPGDGSSDWTLAVKKGRDGREIVKTERREGPVHL